MRDAAAVPIVGRLHALVSRFSREGGNIEAQGDIGEAAARIVQLERVMGALIRQTHEPIRLRPAESHAG